MTHRSAPFVAPNLHLTQSDGSDNSDNSNPSALLVDEKAHKKQVKLLLSTLQADIAQFRDNFFPPPYLTQIQDLPIYAGNLAEVQSYEQTWQALIDRAKGFILRQDCRLITCHYPQVLRYRSLFIMCKNCI